MGREERVVAGVCLTQLVYAIFMFLSHGAFIFASPLNNLLFGVTAVYFAFLNIKKGWISILISLIGAFFVISSPLLLETLLSHETLVYYYSTPLPDLVLFASFLGLIALSGLQLVSQKKKVARFLQLGFILSFIGLTVMNLNQWNIIPFALAFISNQLDKTYRPYQLLWVMLFVFEIMNDFNYLVSWMYIFQ